MMMPNFIFMYVFLYNKRYPYEKSKNFCSAYLLIFGRIKAFAVQKRFSRRSASNILYILIV